MPDKIKKITALEILDSRGEPTLEVKIELANGIIGKAAVPSGASTGRFEAHELRDSDLNRYGGRGVLKAVDNVNNILDQKLKDLRVTDQEQIDNLMIEIDATKNKSKLGANTILGVSLAVAHTAAASAGMPLYQYLRKLYQPDNQQYKLPTPLVNIINGGKHGSTNINLQEFWIVPIKAKSFSEKIQQASNIFHTLGKLLHSVGYDTDLGNEGGYSPEVKSHHEVFDLITQAISMVSLKAGEDILLGIDAGASVFYNAKTENYVLDLEKQSFSSQELIDYYLDLIENYPLYFSMNYSEHPMNL